jgi:hypothetical protein
LAGYAKVGDVPRGTTVLGVDLGGKSRTEAERILADRLASRAGEPVSIVLDGERITLAPAGIGLRLDVEATVGRAMRGPPRLFGERAVAPVVRVSHNKLGAALRQRIDPAHVTFVKPAITYAGLIPRPSYPAPGRALDTGRAVAAVRRAWLTPNAAEVPLTERRPATTRAQVDALVIGLAVPAVAAPVTVMVGARSFTLAPPAIARGLVFHADKAGLLTAAIDPEVLRALAPPGVDLNQLGVDLLAVLPNPAPRRITATPARGIG